MLERKNDHLKICLNEDVGPSTPNPWDAIKLPHCAAPEIDLSTLSLETSFLGRVYSAPFLISCMTGGTEKAQILNDRLASLAQLKNIPMGLGSLRFGLENSDRLAEIKTLRKKYPKADLWGNLGLVQWNYGVTADDVLRLIDELELRVFVLHLNPLQEAIQFEGDKNFSNLLKHIESLKKKMPSGTYLVLKETGCGLDVRTAVRANEAGIDALDVAGLGGTHWGYVEGLRSEKRKTFATLFRNWGIESPQALLELKKEFKGSVPLIGSGGIRHGLDAAKAMALGADFVGLAMSFLKAAEQGEEFLIEHFEIQTEALKIACFASGAKSPKELKTL